MAGLNDLSQEELDRLYLESQSGVQAAPLPHIRSTNRLGENVTGGEFDSTPQAVADAVGLSNRSLEELDRAYFNARPMSTGEDIGRSAVTGAQKGAASLVGLPGSMLNMWGQGVDRAGEFIGEKLGAFTPEQLALQKADREKGGFNYAHVNGIADTEDFNKAIQKYAGPYHEPQTTAGKYAQSIGEMVPGSLAGPGGLLAKGGLAVSSGTGAELAGSLTEGSKFEPWARMGGSIVGGLAAGGIHAATTSPQRLVANALGNVEPAVVGDAIALMRAAEQRGIQLTMAEAVQQVTNGATGMGRMQRVIEGTRHGNERLAPMFAERPGQVRQAGMDFADRIAPPHPQPSMIGRQAQEAAQGGLDMTRGVINDAAKPHYDALRGQLVPDADYAPLAADQSYRAALAELRGNAELNGPIAHLPDNDLSVVNEVVKQLDTGATAARQTAQNPAGNNRLAGLRGDARTMADNAAANVSPDWRQARDIVAQGRQQYLEPLEAGPTGAIARTDDVAAQTGRLYPRSPLEGAPNETQQALSVMRAAEAEAANRTGAQLAMPGSGADLTRQHLVRELNSATADLQPGANQWGGAKYAKALAGNPEQAATLRAGIETVAGNGAGDELDTLLNVLRATGKREAQGSKTAFNAEDLTDLKGQKLGTSLKNATNPVRWGDAIGDTISGLQYRANVNRLAQMLQATPDEAERILQAAHRQGPGRSGMLAQALMTSSAGGP